jgi:hypothetical protein
MRSVSLNVERVPKRLTIKKLNLPVMIRSRGPHIQEQAETRASEFCIPTATRTDQVMGARWSAFKVDAGSVENPAGRTTGGLTRRPGLRSRLNDAPRTAILSSLRRRAQTVRHFVAVFLGTDRESPATDGSLDMILQPLGDTLTQARPAS